MDGYQNMMVKSGEQARKPHPSAHIVAVGHRCKSPPGPEQYCVQPVSSQHRLYKPCVFWHCASAQDPTWFLGRQTCQNWGFQQKSRFFNCLPPLGQTLKRQDLGPQNFPEAVLLHAVFIHINVEFDWLKTKSDCCISKTSPKTTTNFIYSCGQSPVQITAGTK